MNCSGPKRDTEKIQSSVTTGDDQRPCRPVVSDDESNVVPSSRIHAVGSSAQSRDFGVRAPRYGDEHGCDRNSTGRRYTNAHRPHRQHELSIETVVNEPNEFRRGSGDKKNASGVQGGEVADEVEIHFDPLVAAEHGQPQEAVNRRSNVPRSAGRRGQRTPSETKDSDGRDEQSADDGRMNTADNIVSRPAEPILGAGKRKVEVSGWIWTIKRRETKSIQPRMRSRSPRRRCPTVSGDRLARHRRSTTRGRRARPRD